MKERKESRKEAPHMNRTNVMSKVDERKRRGGGILKLENSEGYGRRDGK